MEYPPKRKQGIPHNQCTSGKNIRNPSICLEITTFLNKDTKTLSLICLLPKQHFKVINYFLSGNTKQELYSKNNIK